MSIDRHKPDILALNETWLKEGQDLCAPKVPGYVLKLSPRPGGRKGGGVGFYIRRGLNARVREHPDSALEQLWLEVRPRGMGRIAVGTAYRPDSSSKTRVPTGVAIDALSESISSFGECSLVCVMTDFNVDLLKPSLTPAPEVLTFFQQQNLTNLVNEPTRVVENSATLLDLIITDNPQLFRNLSVHHNPSLSDHAMVLVDLAIKIPKEPPQYVWTRVLSKIDEKNFLQDLKEQPWSEILKYDDVEIMTSHFNDLLTCIFDKHSPLKRIRINQRPRPWLTDVVKHMMFLRDKAWSKALATKTERHRRYFKDLKNLVNSAIKSEKRAYFNFFVNNNLDNPKQMWKHLKQTAGVSGNAALPSIPKVLNDPEKINSFFLDVPGDARADNKLVEFFKENKFTESQFSIDNCSEEEVAKIINSINTNASGHDLISIGMIRMTLVVTLPIITRIINKSITSKKIPDTWKIAKVIPLPKGTTVEEFKDLRPISILPVLSKIVERVVYTQLSKYLEAENILPDMQSGFRGEHGTSTALAHVTDEIIQASDSGNGSILTLLDFSRAFDCINTELLLAKMSHYGLSKSTCEWFGSYLSNRSQFVQVTDDEGNQVNSSVKHVTRGCPQGSILSPLIFVLYTADLIGCITFCKVHLYADDTQVYFSFKPKDTSAAVEKINKDLDAISAWAQKNTLVLNPNKSKFMVLGTRHQCESIIQMNPCIEINQQSIERVTKARNLGLVLDSELRYVEHINNIIRSAFFRLKVLYRIRCYLTERVRILLTESLVLSLFNFCDVVYGPRLFAKTERAIQRVQNACARFCFDIPRRSHVSPFLNQKGILKMSARRKLHLACLFQRVVQSRRPKYLYTKFVWARDHCTYHHTRSKESHKIIMTRHNTEGYRGCFKYAASKIWNDLPPPLHEPMTNMTFKKHLRRIYFNIQNHC